MEKSLPVDSLSFVAKRDDGSRDFWRVPEDAPADIDRQSAEELITYGRHYMAPMILRHVVARIVELKRVDGPAEIAFFNRIMVEVIGQ